MGTKRPFDEELQQFIKYPRHFDYDNSNKQPLFSHSKPLHEASQNPVIPGEAGGIFFHTGDGLDNNNLNNISSLPEKAFETSTSLSLVTCINGEEITGSGASFCSSFFPEFFDFNLPRRQLHHFDDTYTSLLNCSPRKEVPLGPNHQADVPEFDSEVAKSYSTKEGNISDNGSGECLLGVCIIPIPDYNLLGQDIESVDERLDCHCLDNGSVRCVQQHIKEARVRLRENIGHEKYAALGLYEMGEEVALKWTEEEERIFHEVVYSNPVSLEKNFWEQLSMVFPSRTKKELVSYYFNVFMLRRRAVQNRSRYLDIDSDNDEWQGNDNRAPFRSRGEDAAFVVKVDHGDDSSSSEEGEFEDDDDNDNDNDDDDDGNGDVLIGLADTMEKDVNVEVDVKEDSCTTFEGQQYLPEQVRSKPTEQVKPSSSEYSLHPCEGKGWDTSYTVAPTKSVDLLSTCSMIEEIFGPSKNEKSF